jgi:hypothetical protein
MYDQSIFRHANTQKNPLQIISQKLLEDVLNLNKYENKGGKHEIEDKMELHARDSSAKKFLELWCYNMNISNGDILRFY